MPSILKHEAILRIGVFVSVLVFMLLLEYILPRKERHFSRRNRWPANLLLILIDSIAVRIFIPVATLSFTIFTQSKGWGILNYIQFPIWLEIVIAIIVLDMCIYWQHVATHKIPILWRFHRVHHSDRDLDTTTGIRFHPIEILLSILFKFLCVFVLGPAVLAVFIFEILLNASALFNHSNIYIHRKLDVFLRKLIVTPDMHRVHHSVINKETDSNFGFFLSVWDRVFSSYIAQPEKGHDNMKLGLSEYQTEKPNGLLWCLLSPFEKSHKLSYKKTD